MPTNRDLLKEAIADAKSIKETAIANAKAALEEAFTPHLKSMLSAKLEEMDREDDEVEVEIEEVEIEEMDAASFDEKNGESIDASPRKVGQTTIREEEETEEGIDLDELLAELEKDEDTEEVNESEEMEGTDEVTEVEEEEAEEADDLDIEDAEEGEEVDLEDMTEDDLKTFIEDVIKDMVESGELEPGDEMGEEMEDEESEMGDEIDIDMEDDAEEEIMAETEDLDEGDSKEIEELKKELQEVNLLNAKLLYTNKIFKAKNLTEDKKVKVLKAFDKVTTVKEAKLVFETLNEGIASKTVGATRINEVKGRASKMVGSMPTKNKQPIVESNDMVLRFQKLAGIIE